RLQCATRVPASPRQNANVYSRRFIRPATPRVRRRFTAPALACRWSMNAFEPTKAASRLRRLQVAAPASILHCRHEGTAPMRIKYLLTISIIALCLPLLGGCAVAQHNTESTASTPAYRLLFYSRVLRQATPAQRMAMLGNARDHYARQPSALAAARLGLAYGQPGYKGYAPENGWRYTHKALVLGSDYWDAAATAFLRQFIALSADNAEVRKQLAQNQAQDKALRQQLQDLRLRERALGRQLSHAQRKLHALSRVEGELKP